MSALPHRQPAPVGQCHGPSTSTALKWGQDGELSAVDLERILARLAAVDPVAHQLDASQFSQLQLEQG